MTANSTQNPTTTPADLRPRPDGNTDPAGEAGWFLQREREIRGISLEVAGNETGIHPYHLNAIEQGDLAGLPARAMALDMIAAYAAFLDFDPQPLVQHFDRLLPDNPLPLQGHEHEDRTQRPAPLSSAKIIKFPVMDRLLSMRSGSGGIVASVLGAILLFGAASWVFMPNENYQGPGGNMTAQTKMPPQDKAATVVTARNQPLDDDKTASGKLANDADRAANSLSGLEKLIAKNALDPNLTTSAIKPGPVERVDKSVTGKNGGRIFGSANTGSRLMITARSNVWVRIEDANGNVVMTRTMMAGDSYRVPDRPGLVVITRDGGLLSYSIDGKAKGKLGRDGEILVGRPLDLDKLAGNG